MNFYLSILLINIMDSLGVYYSLISVSEKSEYLYQSSFFS